MSANMNNGKHRSKTTESFFAGLSAGSPIVAGIIPFGLVYGATANSLGLSLLETCGMSLIVFAGSTQLVFLDLWGQNASLAVIVLTGLVVNLRMIVYSASLSTQLGPLSSGQSLAGPYFLGDESYGVSMACFASGKKRPPSPFYFYVGTAIPTCLSWQLSGLAGYVGGSFIPKSWPLGMAVPLIFLALLVPMLDRGPKLTTALTAVVAAVTLAGLPMKLGLIAAVFSGIAAGVVHVKIRGEKS